MGASLPAASGVAKLPAANQRAAVAMVNRRVVLASRPARIARAENFAMSAPLLSLRRRDRSWSATNTSGASPRCTAGSPTTEAMRRR